MLENDFVNRQTGPDEHDIERMLQIIGCSSLDELTDQTVPSNIRLREELRLEQPLNEYDCLNQMKKIISENKIFKTYIGTGYYNTYTPAVIQRNILENPAWYTSYTPYQAEISQGRLEALLNFQTMINELTGMEISNASLLDEATATAEAMTMMYNLRSRQAVKEGKNILFVDSNIFPQTLAVIKTRAKSIGIEIQTGKYSETTLDKLIFGAVVQYPAGDGAVEEYSEFCNQLHAQNALLTVVADILSLTLLKPPSRFNADIVTGSTQRFGIPMYFGGPHAAYFATREKFKRNMPGRIIGISKDMNDKPALRMALQTREQHIRREKATSNICTAQALLATMAGMYAVYYGPRGIKQIATEIHSLTSILAETLESIGYKIVNKNYFDTLKIELPPKIKTEHLQQTALRKKINIRYFNKNTVGVSIDETTTIRGINKIFKIFCLALGIKFKKKAKHHRIQSINDIFLRTDDFLTQAVFNNYHSETEMMRYIKKLERKDYSLTHSMISLGSCTMKLNPAVSMLPLSWPELCNIHPFVPANQAEGFYTIFRSLETALKQITGFKAVTFQPNSGAAGEYTGLMVIKAYLESKKQANRNVVLIPASAHGTNPASAVMAGLKVIIVNCDENGNIDISDFKQKVVKNKENLAALMVTYPSTHGVFESKITKICGIIHENGGQVYMDGANMNAQTGLTNPAVIGADVCHINLHKTFAIPHGGGGPGAGPVAVAEHLEDFLPAHPVIETGRKNGITAVAAAPFGSAAILPISMAYINMLGSNGLTRISKIAILNANYIASILKTHYDILYSGENGRVAHELIIDCRKFKDLAGITETDIAKRLIDYGFHAPTLSFPVAGTLMVEPTESESLSEINRFIEAMISIKKEIDETAQGKADKEDNVLKNAPHTLEMVTANEWKHPYSRQKAAYPLPWIKENKFFASIARLNDAYGDRHLICTIKE